MAEVGQAMSPLEPQPVIIYIGNGRDPKGGPGTFIKNLIEVCEAHIWIEFHGLKSSSIVGDALVNPRTVGTMLLHDCSACPNSAFESQALGLPVIGSQGGANPEILLFKELLLDPFQKSPALFRRQLLFALEFCLTLPPQKRTQLADMTASAFGDNKFEEYLRFIEFVVQQKAHRTGHCSH